MRLRAKYSAVPQKNILSHPCRTALASCSQIVLTEHYLAGTLHTLFALFRDCAGKVRWPLCGGARQVRPAPR
jgi:hypothetical protein